MNDLHVAVRIDRIYKVSKVSALFRGYNNYHFIEFDTRAYKRRIYLDSLCNFKNSDLYWQYKRIPRTNV